LDACFVALFEFVRQDLFSLTDAQTDIYIVFISAYVASAGLPDVRAAMKQEIGKQPERKGCRHFNVLPAEHTQK
jgi:hypothetical protein